MVADGLAGHLGAVDLRKMCLDFTGDQALGGQRDHEVFDAGQPTLAFAQRSWVRRWTVSL
jgi:hypothetical protein